MTESEDVRPAYVELAKAIGHQIPEGQLGVFTVRVRRSGEVFYFENPSLVLIGETPVPGLSAEEA